MTGADYATWAFAIAMAGDQILVGGIAIVMGIAALFVSFGPWSEPYELKLPQTIARKFGTTAARSFYLILALTLILAGFAIIAGIRPGYVHRW